MIAGNEAPARAAFRKVIFGLAKAPVRGRIADVVSLLADQAQPPPDAASVLLRAIAIEHFLAETNANQLSRSVVTVVEKGLPNVANFLKLGEKKQTFEKYDALVRAKEWVDRQLSQLKVPYTSLASLLSARKTILKSLSHGRLIEFGSIYKISEVKDAISSVFFSLDRVSEINITLVTDVEMCEHSITDARALIDSNPSFITVEYLKPFLTCATELLHEFVSSNRSRFTALIDQDWSGTTLPKRYPLRDNNRDLRILVPFSNKGRGAATDVRVKILGDSENILFENDEITLGSVAPGKFSVALDAHVFESCSDISLILDIEWGEVGTTERRRSDHELRVLAQKSGIDWSKYTYTDPYGTDPAQGSDFVGREEQVRTLIARMLRRPMGSCYITGQKRVGKTSLAKESANQAQLLDSQKKFFWHYILWGQIAHEDPRVSLRHLGEEIEEFMIDKLPNNLKIPKGNFDGSLSPLFKLSMFAKEVDSEYRFIIIIDEFDEMPQELYLQGNLADTVFGNIRALTTTNNICLLLVGGENMPFVMDRQGQKLNKLSRIDLTYFDRSSEWDDYMLLIREPSAGLLNWHEDAIIEVYNLTNGNPYFSNIICSKIFSRAVSERDIDVTKEEVRVAVDAEISRFDDNLFAHLWQDGISEPIEAREPIILQRKRVLAAFARCIRAGVSVTIANLIEHQSSSELSEVEMKSVLADFVSRKVIVEVDDQYRAVLPIFELWLADIGLTRLASDTLSQNLAADAQRAEDNARVLSRELVELTEMWPTYRGKHVGPEEVRAWLDQLPSSRDQRALFSILKAIRFLSVPDVLERIRNARLTAIGVVEASVRTKIIQRRNDIIVTYVDGEGKSGQQYSSWYAEENLISTSSIMPCSNFQESYSKHVKNHSAPKVIVIVDDIVGTGKSLSDNIKKFHDSNLPILSTDRPLVLAFSLFSTLEGQQNMLRELSKLEYDRLDFRAGEILDKNASLFAESNDIFSTTDERDRAKALASEIGASIYRNAPLGYGNQSLGIVFPTTVPNNSLPLLHSRSKNTSRPWRPLFERLVN